MNNNITREELVYIFNELENKYTSDANGSDDPEKKSHAIAKQEIISDLSDMIYNNNYADHVRHKLEEERFNK